ncbi:MAG: DUF5671 domain-containing protein [Patescibacteria group bacterium]
MINSTSNNSAKFAFFYALSLVALVFMATSVGMIIFQIINKNIIDVIDQYSSNYSPTDLKLAISALIISAPIFYFTIWQIFKNLITGALSKDSAIRRWLTYFILLIVSIVMIGWFIGAINNFLGGEITVKFILKAITAILISAIIFTFYFYDIKREDVDKKNNKIILTYFYCSLIIIVAVFIASLFFVESPAKTRNRKLDNAILQRFDRIDSEIQSYYIDKKKLPDNFKVLLAGQSYLNSDDLKDPATNVAFDYKVSGGGSYQLCANFRLSNKDKNIQDEGMNDNFKERWSHEIGYQCLNQKIAVPLIDVIKK